MSKHPAGDELVGFDLVYLALSGPCAIVPFVTVQATVFALPSAPPISSRVAARLASSNVAGRLDQARLAAALDDAVSVLAPAEIGTKPVLRQRPSG